MEIGLSSACFYPIGVEESIGLMKNIGFNTGEVFLNTESEYDEQFINKLVEEKNKNDFFINSVHAFSGVFEPYLFDKYKRRQKDMIKTFKKVCKAANLLGANYYTFHGMKINNLYNLDIKYIIDVYNELSYIAGENNIKIAQENVAWCMSSNLNFLKILREECRNSIYYTLDIKQAYKVRQDPINYIDVMGEKIVNVHINDKDDKNICLLPGQGDIDYKKISCKLKEIRYNNIYTIEVYRENYSSYEELTKSKDFLINNL